jgi:membrane-bound ClpP family serine protease
VLLIVLGIAFMVIAALIAKLAFLWVIGIICIVVGLILLVLGYTGHFTAGRRPWY